MKSMTGYGAAEGPVGRGKIFVEIRAVNHRYNDLSLKIPPKLNVLDPKLRKLLTGAISRGKIEMFIKERQACEPAPKVTVNIPLARAYERGLRDIERTLKLSAHDLFSCIPLGDVLRVEDPEIRYDRLWPEVSRVAQKALAQFDKMRSVEGAHLLKDQRRRLKLIQQMVAKVEARMKLLKAQRAAELAATGALDRSDVTEELVRFASHCAQYGTYLSASGAVGRQLDFLLQEMNREVNTIASKAGDASVSQLIVDVKSELEKLREQAQNIE